MCLSVIIPAFNEEKYIADCLQSVLYQEIDFSMEVIVVNDGSTDSTREIVQSYAERDRRVVLINQPNKGFSGARNAGIDEARGRLICFVDSDDMLAQGHLAELVSVFEKSEADYVNGMHTNLTEGGRLAGKGEDHRHHGAPWGRVYSRRVWENLRFPEGYWFEDTVHAFCIEPKWVGVEVPNWGYLYRRNKRSITKSAGKSRKALDSYWIAEELLEWCRLLSVPFNQQLLNSLISQLGTVTFLRNASMNDDELRCLFVLAASLLSSQNEFFGMHNSLGKHYRDVEQALRTLNFRLWEHACLWS